MTYDHWKTTNPADEHLGPEPSEPCKMCNGRREVYLLDQFEKGWRSAPCTCVDVPPEVYQECSFCNGEGYNERWESVSKWSIDPPSATPIRCDVCNGAGGFICEAEGDR